VTVPRRLALLVVFACAIAHSTLALDRYAFTFTSYELQIQLDPPNHGFGVQGRITLRNDTSAAQRNPVLQISSSLEWRSITVGDRKVAYVTHPYQSDVDHTGSLSEAVVTLARPLAPGETIRLDLTYTGAIAQDSTRLTRIGTPEDRASAADWDQISTDFTAVRGAGYVVWYPIAMDSASLADGAAYSLALARWRAQESHAEMQVRFIKDENLTPYMNDDASGLFRTCGDPLAAGSESATNPDAETATCYGGLSFRFAPIAARTITFLAGNFMELKQPPLHIYYLLDHAQAAKALAGTAAGLRPFLHDWLPQERPGAPVRIFELADQAAMPFAGYLQLLMPLHGEEASTGDLFLVHALSGAMFPASRTWIIEGAAGFMQAALLEKRSGREAALDFMQQQLPALAAEEKAIAAQTQTDTSLIAANDDVLYRAKSMYVVWMLRDMLGENPLKAALGKYSAAEDKDPAYFQRLLEQSAAASHLASKLPLQRFFDDWVYHDRGLPDFIIASTYNRKLVGNPNGSNFLVTVVVQNLGNAAAEVPVTLTTSGRETLTQRVAVPAKGQASVRFSAVNQPLQVTVNDGSVPESDTSNNTSAIGPAVE